MSTITITSGKDTSTAKFIVDGHEIKSATACDLRIRLNEPLRAVLELYVDDTTIEAEPMLGIKTVKEAAKHYGFDLAPDGSTNFFVVRSGTGYVCDSVTQEMTTNKSDSQKMSFVLASKVAQCLESRGLEAEIVFHMVNR